MGLFVIGDPHLSFGTDKPMDIFSGWTDYTEKLSTQWRDVVSANDTVVVAGDISWGMTLDQSLPDFQFLHELPGRKIFLKGNHDYWWTTKTRMDRYFAEHGLDTLHILHNNAYTSQGFSLCGTRGWINETGEPEDQKVLLREAGRLEASLKAGLETGLPPLVFLHYPPVYLDDVNRPLLDVLKRYDVKKCYYGHIHGKAAQRAVRGLRDGIEYDLVACDFVGFKPVRIA